MIFLIMLNCDICKEEHPHEVRTVMLEDSEAVIGYLTICYACGTARFDERNDLSKMPKFTLANFIGHDM